MEIETQIPQQLRAADLRHELRTPLNQIIGYSEMLLEDAAQAGHAEVLDELSGMHALAHDVVRRIQELIPAPTEKVDDAGLRRVREGVASPVSTLLDSATKLLAREDAFLHPFSRHIVSAARELDQFAVSGSLPGAPVQNPTPVSSSDSASGEPPRASLLIADDSDRNREMLTRQLERQGYAITAVGDGMEALRFLRQQPFDLVLLDVLMPRLDGFATLEEIKSDPSLREIPVIMISASDEYRSVIRCIESGAEDYLPKPFDPVLLRARLKASLEKKALRDQQRAKTEELERAYNDLKKMQNQLLTQEKLASLGALTAGIAHEIKNPLNFITNFASLSSELVDEIRDPRAASEAERSGLLEDLATNIRKIEEHGHRADRIVRGMLGHARKQSGARELTDVNALIDECIHLAYHGMRSQDMIFNAQLETDFDPAAGKLYMFPQDLSRVFLNIATNAFHALQERAMNVDGEYQPVLRVSTRALEGEVEARIRDNGKGIPAKLRDKIFEPFFTTKPAGTGTGLGLSISRDVVVNEHNGSLQVESEEGAWTEFVVRLPRENA